MPLLGQNLSRALSSAAILAPGLIGTSIALALQKTQPNLDLRIWARRREAARALQTLIPSCFASDDLQAVLRDARLIVLCCPVPAMAALAKSIAQWAPSDAIVTDAGSVKQPVVQALEPVFGARFIGSHPMAGSEQSGHQAGRSDLFQGATCILTPTDRTAPDTQNTVRAFWESLGCQIRQMSPLDHDHAIARISHLPHAVASALVLAACGENPELQSLSGGGYRDTSRIALGPAPMWADIFLGNRDEVLASLDALREQLAFLRLLMEREDLQALTAYLEKARAVRLQLK